MYGPPGLGSWAGHLPAGQCPRRYPIDDAVDVGDCGLWGTGEGYDVPGIPFWRVGAPGGLITVSMERRKIGTVDNYCRALRLGE